MILAPLKRTKLPSGRWEILLGGQVIGRVAKSKYGFWAAVLPDGFVIPRPCGTRGEAERILEEKANERRPDGQDDNDRR